MKTDRQRGLELALVLVGVGLTCLLYKVDGFKLVVLNLFYLPVVLAAFFLGRYRAGVLALFCVVSATVVTVLDLDRFAPYVSPVTVGLSITIWGAVMGLNALLVGTLSDERAQKLHDLHDAYIGVVEVLSRYLASADPASQDRSRRVAELSQCVAQQLRLSAQEVDDVRVAALLREIENVEVTARVLGKALGDLGQRTRHQTDQHTFYGSDLVQSLGRVLTGALPLLHVRRDAVDFIDSEPTAVRADVPFGAHVIETVRTFDVLRYGVHGRERSSARAVLDQLHSDIHGEHHPAVLHALEQVVCRENASEAVLADTGVLA